MTTGTVTLDAAAGDAVRKFQLHAYTGGLVNLPQYEIPVVFDLASMRLQENATQLPLLRNHDPDRGVGHAENVAIDTDAGVTGVGFMSVPGDDRDAIVEAADNGKEWQLSVGGSAPESSIEYIPDGQTFRMNNRTLQGPALAVTDYLLRETSFVEAGADNTGAIATLLAAYKPQTEAEHMTFEKWLAKMGVDVAALTADGVAKLRKQFNAEMAADSDEDTVEVEVDDDEESDDESAVADSAGTTDANDAVAESIRQNAGEVAAQEVERNDALAELNAKFGRPKHTVNGKQVPLLATALREGWKPEKFELNCLRNQRPQKMSSTKTVDSGGRVAMLASMVFAVMSHGNGNVAADFRKCDSARQYLNASLMADPEDANRYKAFERSHDYRHHDLIDLVASAMALDGIECSSPKKSDKWFQAAFSSNSVQDLFTQSTQALLLDTYMQNAATYANFASICTQVDVPNFLTNERKTVSPSSGELGKLNPTGTAGDAQLSATGEEYKIARFAKRWGIDDQDMISENFGVFREMPQFLGMSAARLFGQVVAKLMLSNPNLSDGNAWFNATDGNLVTSSALTAANLKAALTTFGTQVDGSVSLELDPNVLFTPKALRFTAAEIMNGAPLITGNTTTQTSANVLAGTIDSIVHSALLDNGFTDPDDRATAIAGDATSWYLFDNRYPAIEVGHLQGSGRGPTIRTGTYSDGKYGVWFDVKRDLGAAPLRRPSAQKNTA